MAIALSVDECLSLEMCTLNYSVSHTMLVLALVSKCLYNTTPVPKLYLSNTVAELHFKM